MDYDRPALRSMGIFLIRHRAADSAHRIGTLIVNPGGPGGSGVHFALQSDKVFPAEILDRFDVVGFDPRGVGRSTPVHCSGFDASPTPETPQSQSSGVEAAIREAKAFGAECLANTGEELGYFDSLSAAKDMERIRIALGEDKLSYFGFSYGTLLGATYADLFPDRVRAVVLDGAVDPSLDYARHQTDQAVALESALQTSSTGVRQTRAVLSAPALILS